MPVRSKTRRGELRTRSQRRSPGRFRVSGGLLNPSGGARNRPRNKFVLAQKKNELNKDFARRAKSRRVNLRNPIVAAKGWIARLLANRFGVDRVRLRLLRGSLLFSPSFGVRRSAFGVCFCPGSRFSPSTLLTRPSFLRSPLFIWRWALNVER